MKPKSKQSGLTLVETTVVITVVAVLTSLSMPAIRTFFSSMASQGNTRALVSAALSSARAIAAKEQRYAGIRFQKAYNPDDPLNPLNAPQYMIFIVHDFDRTGLANGFRAVEGIQPIKLPDTIGVMDLMVRTHTDLTPDAAENPESSPIMVNNLDNEVGIRDTSSFSVVFSPSGKLVVHSVRVRGKSSVYQPETEAESVDSVFNGYVNIRDSGIGMFVQDDYAELGLGAESSRNSFVIYDKARFDRMDKNERYDYLMNLMNLDAIYINPYTGTIISAD